MAVRALRGPIFGSFLASGASISKQREKRRGPVTKRWLVLPELGWVVMDGKLPRQRILIVTIWRDPVRTGRAVPSMPSQPPFETAAANSGGDVAPMLASWIGPVQPRRGTSDACGTASGLLGAEGHEDRRAADQWAATAEHPWRD